MKKRVNKKLQLHVETIRKLDTVKGAAYAATPAAGPTRPYPCTLPCDPTTDWDFLAE